MSKTDLHVIFDPLQQVFLYFITNLQFDIILGKIIVL